MDPTLPSFSLLRVLWSQLQKFTLDPAVSFGSPQQRATEPWRVWWHVPVAIKRRWWSWRTSIPRCIVQMIPADSDPKRPFEKPLNLRWTDRDSADGRSEVTLDCGRLRIVPIAIRDEIQGVQRLDAQITGEAYLRDKLQKFRIGRGAVVRFRLRVLSGASIWISGHVYRIDFVGDDQSNGHFVLEIETQDPY